MLTSTNIKLLQYVFFTSTGKIVLVLFMFLIMTWILFHYHVTIQDSHINNLDQKGVLPTSSIVDVKQEHLRITAQIIAASNSSDPIKREKIGTIKNVDAVLVQHKEIDTKKTGREPLNSVKGRKLHAVTYASHHGRDDRFCRSLESAIRHDYNLVVLGWQLPWKGLSQKLEAAYHYASTMPENDLLLFTDAFDVLYTEQAQHILDVFAKHQYKILFAAECGCWPHIMDEPNVCFTGYPKSPTPYRYLNSGTWIGVAKYAREMLAEVIAKAGKDFKNANDQKLVADMFISGKYGIKLDYQCEVFQSMHNTDPPGLPYCNPRNELVLTNDKRWQNKLTNTRPAIFHFNGGGKKHHLQMEGSVWYKGKEFYTGMNGKMLREHYIMVPSAKLGKLSFEAMCQDYLNSIHYD